LGSGHDGVCAGQSVGVTHESATRLLAGRAGRSLCHAIATVAGFGEVRLPLSFRVGRARVEQTSASELLDEVEAAVANGNFGRFLAAADASLLALWLQDSTTGCATPTVEDPLSCWRESGRSSAPWPKR